MGNKKKPVAKKQQPPPANKPSHMTAHSTTEPLAGLITAATARVESNPAQSVSGLVKRGSASKK
jgi:hypothetical protein